MPDRTVGLKIFKKGWAHARRKMEKLGSRPEKKLFVREQNCSLPNLYWQSHKNAEAYHTLTRAVNYH